MDRITNTDKWKDDWFIDLHRDAKLIFMFLSENCDEAGFYKVNTKHMYRYLGMPAEDIVAHTRALEPKIIFDKSRKKVWVKNFLFYQRQLPLEKNNPEHKKIKLILEKNLAAFDNDQDMLFILNKVETGKGARAPKRFKKPTTKELAEYGKEYAFEANLNLPPKWEDRFYNHYEANGWKVGGRTKMKDWKAAVRNWVSKPPYQLGNDKPKAKIDKIKDANSNIPNLQVD